MADARGRAYRKSSTSGTDDVRTWIGKWWGDTKDLAIREFSISVPAPSSIKKLHDDEVFKTSFRNKRDSDLHSLLKYAAWIWLSKEESIALPCQSDLVRFEQMIYLPSTEGSSFNIYTHPLGGDFDWTMAQPIRRGDRNVSAAEGLVRTVDVFGKGTNIEVGNTQPFNLLSPLTDILTRRAVWVPFPAGVRPKDFELENSKLRPVTSYEIRFVD